MSDRPILPLDVPYVKRDKRPQLADGMQYLRSIWYAVLRQETQRVGLKENMRDVHL